MKHQKTSTSGFFRPARAGVFGNLAAARAGMVPLSAINNADTLPVSRETGAVVAEAN